MSQPERKSFLELLSAVPLDARGDLAVLRPVFEEFMLQTPLPSDVSVTETTLGIVPVLEISVPEVIADAALLYFHGGVFALGSARASPGLACLLARQARRRCSPLTTGSPRSIHTRQPPTARYGPTSSCSRRGSARSGSGSASRPELRWRWALSSPAVIPGSRSRLQRCSQLDVTRGVPHVFQASAPECDEANAALARTGAFLQSPPAARRVAAQRGQREPVTRL
jgi:hypothetical protein